MRMGSLVGIMEHTKMIEKDARRMGEDRSKQTLCATKTMGS